MDVFDVNWINNIVCFKICDFWKKCEVLENFWIKCLEIGEMVFYCDLEVNFWVVFNFGYYMWMLVCKCLEMFFDDGDYMCIEIFEVQIDFFKFCDIKWYMDCLKEVCFKIGEDEVIYVVQGKVNGIDMIVVVQDFVFVGGLFGMVVGEVILVGMMKVIEDKMFFVMFVVFGGVCMQEGIFFLMQMFWIMVGIQLLCEVGLFYIVVLINLIMGGVFVFYVMFGDVYIVELGVMIGFVGCCVIEQMVCEKFLDDFQMVEYLFDYGMVDMVVLCQDMKEIIVWICGIFMKWEVELL